MLIDLSTNLPGFSYRQFASQTGADLRFTDSTGLVLVPHEIDEWNTNGVSAVWVSVPRLAGPTNAIWAYWGNPLATNPPSAASVWMPDYDLVWHLRESGFPVRRQHATTSGADRSCPGIHDGRNWTWRQIQRNHGVPQCGVNQPGRRVYAFGLGQLVLERLQHSDDLGQ